jgi:hypothetical protein
MIRCSLTLAKVLVGLFYGVPSMAAILRGRRCATLKIAPGDFFY